MKTATIRLVFILALLCAIGIIATQVFWVKRAYDLEKKEFNLNVNTALRNVATRIWEIKDIQPLVYNVVDRVNPDYFIVQINVSFESELLGHLLKEEFENNNLITDFEYAGYDCMEDTFATQHYVHMSGSNEKHAPSLNFPPLKRENYYFGVYFPHRSSFVSQQLSIWYYSSLGLLCVLLFLGYVIFIILKQKRLSEIQKDFINNMAHEFKTPLSSIQIASEVLKNPKILEQPQRLLSYATIIDNEAAQLVLQIERILQTVHSAKGLVQVHKKHFVLQELITELADSFETKLNNKSARLNLSLAKEPIYFYGDKLHLRNMLSNLIDNALKYSKENPVIEIHLEETKKEIKIDVKDNGIGIAEDHLKHIFRKFYRVPTGNVHNVKGFGLGLNYVELITKVHGGKISCDSREGIGSTFCLRFLKNK